MRKERKLPCRKELPSTIRNCPVGWALGRKEALQREENWPVGRKLGCWKGASHCTSEREASVEGDRDYAFIEINCPKLPASGEY